MSGQAASYPLEGGANAGSGEAILRRLTTRLLDVQPEALGGLIIDALAELADLFDVDRAYAVATEPRSLTISLLEEWWRPGVEQVPPTPIGELPIEAQRFWARNLRQGDAVQWDDVHNVPSEGVDAASDLIKTKVKSILLVPLRSSYGAVGFVGFEARREPHHWTPAEVSIVRTVGEMLVITIDRCRAEAALQQAVADLAQRNRDLERSNRDLEQFASIVSHDLKSPLMLIEGYVDLIAAAAGNPEKAELVPQHAAAAKRGAARMGELIDDLLAYSRSGAGLRERENVSLSHVITEVIADLGPLIAATGGEVRAGPLPDLIGDRSQLRQLLQNLVSNALKFHRPDHAPVVDISATSDEDHIAIVVADNGVGIEPERRAEVFEMFKRGPTPDTPGTGIGLTIAARVVENHGGEIDIEDNPGGGTRVVVTLPVRA